MSEIGFDGDGPAVEAPSVTDEWLRSLHEMTPNEQFVANAWVRALSHARHAARELRSIYPEYSRFAGGAEDGLGSALRDIESAWQVLEHLASRVVGDDFEDALADASPFDPPLYLTRIRAEATRQVDPFP
jgi:hypothetical protein